MKSTIRIVVSGGLALSILAGCRGSDIQDIQAKPPVESISKKGEGQFDVKLAPGVELKDVLNRECFGIFWGVWSLHAAERRFGQGIPRSSLIQGSRVEYETEGGVVYYEVTEKDGVISQAMGCLPKNRSVTHGVDPRVLDQIPSHGELWLTIAPNDGRPPAVQIFVVRNNIEQFRMTGLEEIPAPPTVLRVQ
jgi:hypothetical protein